MKKLIIDVDDVICEGSYLSLLNKFLKTNYTYDDFKSYYLQDIIPSEKDKRKFYELIASDDVYKNSKLFTNAKNVINKLRNVYDVYFCSSCVMRDAFDISGPCFMYKYNYLMRTFPDFDGNKIILTSAKYLIHADIKIDDKIEHLTNAKQKLLFDSYHNKKISNEELAKKNVVRVKNWKEIEKLLIK